MFHYRNYKKIYEPICKKGLACSWLAPGKCAGAVIAKNLQPAVCWQE